MTDKEKPQEYVQKPTYLAAWRKHRKITQEVARQSIGVGSGIISKIERGQIAYQPYQLERLAELYGCKRGDLLDTNPESVADEEARLRSALVAYGVDRDDLPAVMRAISGFVDGSAAQRQTDQPHGQSAPASPRHEEEPLA